jgi:hypothetical protein
MVSTKAGGHGLGLLHAFSAIEGWGKIEIISEKDKGTIVTIRLSSK